MSQSGGHDVREKVRQGYAAIAASPVAGSACCGPSPCCDTSAPADLAAAVGYDAGELATLPEGANMGLSCGNPLAIASLQPGEVVLDLGSGGGFDAFLAAPRVGAAGRVIGVDMTPEMLAKARRNAAEFAKRTGLANVEFRLGEIEHLPVADASVDVVISNCVLNLSPDKPQVWREISRVLKPGGRVSVSDLALLRPLPEAVRGMVEALVGCVAGAVLVSETERFAREACLAEVRLETRDGYVDAMREWNDPLYRKIAEALPQGARASDYITSLLVTAVKPSRCCCSG